MKNTMVKSILSLATAVLATHGSAGSYPDLTTAMGTVLIAAPTAINGPTNQGIWYINPATKRFSLELPDLGANRVYEGWIVDDISGQKISTGLFRPNGSLDSDAAGRYAGPLALNFPPVPGSDFVTLGMNIADGEHRVVITVEPYPDFDPNPSGVAVLAARIPAGTMVGTELTLENVAQ